MALNRKLRRVLVVPLSLALAGPVVAQDVDVQAGASGVDVRASGVDVDVDANRQTSTDRTQRRRGNGDVTDRTNQQIAAWVMVDQESLIDLSTFGLEHTQSDQVRKLAETVIQDHKKISEKLSPLAAWRTRPTWARTSDQIEREQQRRLDAAEDRADEVREERREVIRDARRDADGVRRPLEDIVDRLENGVERVADRTEDAIENARESIDREMSSDRSRRRGVSWVAMHRDVSEAVANAAKEDLRQRQGYEFDASFVGMLVASHIQQEATLEVLSKRASGELSETLRETVDTIREHKRQANEVMDAIKPNTPARRVASESR
ncbi:DUF4142 domain-containing protein [Rhodopirellula sp. SWK7]|uniref:DUF4142 domain-containing protein n=1 Tax=Rhodopirellula sp. SWK7 TaxID=595460 RepID=UPI0002C00AE3|nr:DUF4142 domain-containing protein [Rhodopirellula sp. SWK7]EMI45507.1 secreted protein [Rhodopirellula sp. SWK7]